MASGHPEAKSLVWTRISQSRSPEPDSSVRRGVPACPLPAVCAHSCDALSSLTSPVVTQTARGVSCVVTAPVPAHEAWLGGGQEGVDRCLEKSHCSTCTGRRRWPRKAGRHRGNDAVPELRVCSFRFPVLSLPWCQVCSQWLLGTLFIIVFLMYLPCSSDIWASSYDVCSLPFAACWDVANASPTR